MVKVLSRGGKDMELKEEQDIDDMIFGDEEWHPSER